jgi:hypothetical protein
MQPPHDSITFGEHDRREMRVEPQHGNIGTEFHFKAFHFERRKMVKVLIKGSNDFLIYSGSIVTDDDGSINYFGLSRKAGDDWPVGEYIFSVDGLRTKFYLTS